MNGPAHSLSSPADVGGGPVPLLVDARGVEKRYRLWARPEDRLLAMVPGFRRRARPQVHAALSGVDLAVVRGETVGVLGRNGAGKSTLLMILAGVLAPTAGSVRVAGRVAAVLNLGGAFDEAFTGRENARLQAAALGLTGPRLREAIPRIEAFAAIGDFFDQPLKTYSAGMRARLAYAVAAEIEADLLIVDEALSVGDAAFSQKCMRHIRAFKERGALLFVSHSAQQVLSLCERAVWLEDGRILMDGPAREVTEAYTAAVQADVDDGARFRFAEGRRVAPPPSRAPSSGAGEGAVANKPPDDAPSQEPAEGPAHARAPGVVRVFDFDADAPARGNGDAALKHVALSRRDGSPLPQARGGEAVRLHVRAVAHADLARPIVGFIVRDPLGQELFGENTHLVTRDAPVSVRAAESFEAEFVFRLPYLRDGDHSMTVAVAEGDQDDHRICVWMEDALFLRVSSSHVARGLVGQPMERVVLRRAED